MAPIGQSSPAFCHEPIPRIAEAISHDGFDVWEIFGEGGHALPLAEKEFAQVLPSHSFKAQLHGPISDVNLGSLNPTAWELAVTTQESTLASAARIGVTRVTIHPGNHTPLSRGHYGKLHEQTRKALRRLDGVALELGIELYLENMATGWAFETDSVEKLFDLTQGTEIGYCLDVGHAHIAKRLPEFLERADRFGNVHVHDNGGVTDDHLTLGEGGVPWREAAKALIDAGYRGTFVIESRDLVSGRTSKARLRSSLA